MSVTNDNIGGAGSGSDPRTNAIGGSSGSDEGMGGGQGMGGTQTANTGITVDIDSPGSAVRPDGLRDTIDTDEDENSREGSDSNSTKDSNL